MKKFNTRKIKERNILFNEILNLILKNSPGFSIEFTNSFYQLINNREMIMFRRHSRNISKLIKDR